MLILSTNDGLIKSDQGTSNVELMENGKFSKHNQKTINSTHQHHHPRLNTAQNESLS